MKILFVWPNKDQFGFKPIGISLLSAILKQRGHHVDLFDTTFIDFGFKDNTEVRKKIKIFKDVDFSGFDVDKKKGDLKGALIKKLNEFMPDIVAVSALSDEIYIGFEISSIVKKWREGTIILWGNKAPTMAPEKILGCRDIDYICMGEGVQFIKEFVDCISQQKAPERLYNIAYRDEQGHIKKNELRPYYQTLDSLPFLDWSVFDGRQFLKPYDGKIYRGGDHMIFWGCPKYCTYCINSSYRKLYGSKAGRYIRSYSVDRIIEELSYLVDRWGIDFFKFHDEDFPLKPMNYFRDIANKYARNIGVPFTIMANARNITREKVNLLKKMNCVSVTLGIETGNSELRKKVLKRTETEREIIEATKMFNDAGIRTSAFNMLGIPFESRKTVMETIELNREAEVRYPNAGFFFPLEGTELRDISIQNGFFAGDSDLVFQNDRPSLKFNDISAEELIALRERFILYVKMPKVFHRYIKRSENNDDIAKKLTDELYRIFDLCVFANDGVWLDEGGLEGYLKNLEDISRGKRDE